MKFAILTDIHLGPEEHYKGVLRKMTKDAKIFLDKFLAEMNDNAKPNFVMVLGDLIQEIDEKNDRENMQYIINLLSGLNCPVYYAAGNHDIKKISEEDLAHFFKQKKLYYSFNHGEFHFIVLFSKKISDTEITIDENQVDWLKQDLSNTSCKCVIFVHHSLADQDLTGNPWFEGRAYKCLIANRKEVREILAESKKVIAVFNSHLHWDKRHFHDDIPYFTIQSLTENEDDKGVASEAHAIVDINDGQVQVEIKGNYSKKY